MLDITNTTDTIELVSKDEEIMKCFSTMKTLRAHLKENNFLLQIKELFNDGYQLASLNIGNKVVSVAGFRILKSFSMGKSLYLADLASLETERSQGYGTKMMQWLKTYAHQNGCDAIHLDSGVQRHRAHKFYLNKNMNIECYHFVERFFSEKIKAPATEKI